MHPHYSFRSRTAASTYLLLVLLSFSCIACKKYLDKKPRQNLAVPTSVADLQALMDNQNINGSSPGDLEFVADNYYLEDATYNSAGTNVEYRKAYIWDKEATITDHEVWDQPYTAIYQANFVLDQIPHIKVEESEKNGLNNVKGTALFFRSLLFYQLAQLFCKPYAASAANDPGIVLRTTSAVAAPSTRATVKQTYDQILTDLKTAASLLPVTSVFVTRPNRPAAYGALARVYLSMRDYENAGLYADSSLQLYHQLLDFNSLTPSGSSPLPYFATNPEILLLSFENSAPHLFRDQKTLVDTLLYRSYDNNDLRKTVFFAPGTTAGTYYWRGSYQNYSFPPSIFDGLATDEMYLIRAECYARKLNKDAALGDLNTLMKKRWKNSVPYPDITATDANGALNKILIERRKELAFRGLRWTDLRRFNLENANNTLKRVVNSISYMLPSNDPRWVILIPQEEISQSGIAQNPR